MSEETEEEYKPKKFSLRQNHDDSEDWIVSYADMITLLFGFFVILFSMSTFDPEKLAKFGKTLANQFGGEVSQEVLEQSNTDIVREAQAFRYLIEEAQLSGSRDDILNGIITETSKYESSIQNLKDNLKKLPYVGKTTSSQERTINISLPNSMLFHSGSNKLTENLTKELAQITRWLLRQKDHIDVRVIGHSDSMRIKSGSKTSNWRLSQDRASVVTEALVRFGLDASIVSTVGMAAKDPLYPEKNEDGTWNKEHMQKNRRVHIEVLYRGP